MNELEEHLRVRIAAEGSLSFRDVMEAALYHPTLGYYTRRPAFGAYGDFVTSPSTHPAFGALLARQARDIWQALGQPRPFRILEIGGGDGALETSLMSALELDCAEYAIEEVTVSRALSGSPHLVIANEVLDAQPVHRVVMRGGALRELRVTVEDGRLAWTESDTVPLAIERYFARQEILPPEGGIAEINVALVDWVTRVAARIERGLLLVLDYGYPAEALFARSQGTLLTYWRHTLGSDPLVRLGEQDISAHVDFTTLASAANAAGLTVLGVTSQAVLLRNLGFPQVQSGLTSTADRRALASLVDPHGLGRIGALFAARAMPDFIPAGLRADQTWHAPLYVPALGAAAGEGEEDDFLDQWREAFGSSSQSS